MKDPIHRALVASVWKALGLSSPGPRAGGLRAGEPLTRGWMRRVCVVAAACGVLMPLDTGAAGLPLTASEQRGQAIYVEGRLPDGRALRAHRPGLPHATGAEAACTQCHRRSGLGDQEGRLRVPPITAASLLGPGRVRQLARTASGIQIERSRAEARPAYSLATLRSALASGVDGAGHAFDPWMPRYDLSEAQTADLMAWLTRLGPVGATAVRGLEGQTLHLATILTPDAPLSRRQAVQQTLHAWAGSQTFGAVRLALHDWALKGPPSGWRQQLEALARQRPVFAVVSGAGAAQWAPVEAFCEAQALPCVFPLIDRVPTVKARYYAAYLSDGVLAEARLAARASKDLPAPPARVHLWFDSDLGRDAARQWLAAAARRDDGAAQADTPQPRVPARLWDARTRAGTIPASFGPEDLVISWLQPETLTRLLSGAVSREAAVPRALWLSMQQSPPQSVSIPPRWRAVVGWVSLRSDPARFEATASTGLRPWLQGLGLDSDRPTPVQADLYAASFFFADALQQTRGVWNAEYLLERLESAVNTRAPSGAYVRLSLGPGQRLAAQVGQILSFAPPDWQRLQVASKVINAND